MTIRSVRSFVTVVSGLPRSGTSLMMQMLEAGGMPVLVDEARPPDPDNPRGYYELAAVKATLRDPSWVALAGGRAVKVIHALVAALPPERDYRVIVMRRPLPEVMRSQQRMLERSGGVARADDTAVLARVFESQLEEAVRGLRARERTAVLVIDYPELVRHPLEASARVDLFLGGGLDVRAMAATVDPLLYRNRCE